MKHLKLKLHLISEEFFQYSLITYLLLLLAETLQQGFVSYFFNPNILLGIVLFSGVIMVLTQNEKFDPQHARSKITATSIQYMLLLATVGGFLVFYKTQALGKIALLISILTGIIIVLLSCLIFLEDKK